MPDELDLFDPFRKRKKLSDIMNEFFEPMRIMPAAGIRTPLVDVIDRGKEFKVTAEMPGIDKKDIELNITDSFIEIKTEAKSEKKEEKEKEGYFYHERAYSGFYRKLPLPSEAESEKAGAEFKNGILTVTIPKKIQAKTEKKAKKIQIK